jgi:hypothetical protein
MASRADAIPTGRTVTYSIRSVILASAVGTMIEWCDFYIFGSSAAVLALKFYPPGNDTFAYIAYLATFAVGFVVRPFGAPLAASATSSEARSTALPIDSRTGAVASSVPASSRHP